MQKGDKMSQDQWYLTGAVICFCFCFFFLYKSREKYDNNEITMLLFITILISLLSWLGVFLCICEKILIKKEK